MKIKKITNKFWQFFTVILLSTLLIFSYSWLIPSTTQDNFTRDRQENSNISLQKSSPNSNFAVFAQTPTETEPDNTGEAEEFPVILDGKTLFTIKVDGRTTSAEQRAELTTEEIERIAKNYSISVDSFELQDFEEVIIISAQDEEQEKVIIVGVTNDDAQAVNQPLNELANQYFQIIKDAIVEYREERSREGLGEDILLTLFCKLA